VFGVQARFARDRVTTTGAARVFERGSDDGGRARFHFCPTCGSTVFYALESVPGYVGVPVGAFAEPEFPAPNVSVYEARRHPWTRDPGVPEERFA